MINSLSRKELLDALKKDVKLIIAESEICDKAKKVIDTYTLLAHRPMDDCAYSLCEFAYREWKNSK